MRNQTSARRGCSGRNRLDRCKRSWRSIEAAGVDAQAEVTQRGNNLLPRSIQGFDLDRAGKDAREKGVQRAAIVPVLIAMMRSGRRINLTVRMLMMLVRLDCHRKGRCSGQRRRYNPRELGDQEQANQHADKASNGP